MRPAVSIVLVLLTLLAAPVRAAVPSAHAAAPPARAVAPPVVGAASAVLMDARTGRVLHGVAPHVRRPPASTTKMLTALLVAASMSPETLVPVSERAATDRSGAAIGLLPGERWTAGDLMRAMLMHSANDAAVALAEAVGGSVEEFARQMNARARALGLRDSNFVTPHGRFSPQHYSSAYDLALIAREALRVSWIAQAVRTQTWDLRHGGENRMVINTNSLLWRYPGADGVKTGWIAESGPCLVASATRGGWQLIAVVLNAPRMYTDAAQLLNYGFGAFTRVRGAAAGEVVRTVAVANGLRPLVAAAQDDAVVVVPRGAGVSRQVRLSKTAAPIARGETVGTLVLTSGGVEVGRVPLIAREAVPVRSLLGRLWYWMRDLVDGSP